MKKYFLIIIIKLAFIGTMGWVYQQNKKSVELSDLAVANIEALASGEASGTRLKCYKTISGNPNKTQTHYTYCGSCSPVLGYDAYDESHCYTK